MIHLELAIRSSLGIGLDVVASVNPAVEVFL